MKSDKTSSSGFSSVLFPGLIETESENDIIKVDTSRFLKAMGRVNSINPLRDINNEAKFLNKSKKNMAIMESVVNLKIQYILYNIRDYIRKYQIETNANFDPKKHKIARFLRNITLLIYGIIMFFERPWFCYESATIPMPSYFNFTSLNEVDTSFYVRYDKFYLVVTNGDLTNKYNYTINLGNSKTVENRSKYFY